MHLFTCGCQAAWTPPSREGTRKSPPCCPIWRRAPRRSISARASACTPFPWAGADARWSPSTHPPCLLEELRRHAAGLPVSGVHDDLLSFQRHVNSRVGLILIMGDTLTHLPDQSAVQTLIARAAESLGPGGQFIATFRDYTSPLAGDARFIPVRADENRILTCFLEYGDDHVDVHDLLYERQGSLWQFKVSGYRKLRLSPGLGGRRTSRRGLLRAQRARPVGDGPSHRDARLASRGRTDPWLGANLNSRPVDRADARGRRPPAASRDEHRAKIRPTRPCRPSRAGDRNILRR